ncbi:hypothetical protein V491_07715, partial [Pseudogymnoascus sp. VKM F-3775]
NPSGGGKNQDASATGTDSPSSTGAADATGTNAAVAVGRELSGVTGALAAVMAGFVVLL